MGDSQVVRRLPVKREMRRFESCSPSYFSGCSSACVERAPRTREVAGSNPAALTFCGECRWNYIVLGTISPPNIGRGVSSLLVAAHASEAQPDARQSSKLERVGSSPITRFYIRRRSSMAWAAVSYAAYLWVRLPPAALVV